MPDMQPKQLQDFLHGKGGARLLEAVRSKVRADELVSLALMAASRNPRILSCTAASILRALLEAHHLGIKPIGVQGRGYLVPRENRKLKPPVWEVSFDPGWRGLCDIARRMRTDDGKPIVTRIDSFVVYQGDEFEYYEEAKGPFIHYKPLIALPPEADPETGEITGEDPLGRVVAAFARAIVDGEPQVEVLRRSDIDRIRKKSMATSEGTPWADWYDQMARKAAVKRLCKILPYSPDLNRAERASDVADGMIVDTIGTDVTDAEDAIRNRKVSVAVPGAGAPSNQGAPALGARSTSAADDLFGPEVQRDVREERETVAVERGQERPARARRADRETPAPETRRETPQAHDGPSNASTDAPGTPPGGSIAYREFGRMIVEANSVAQLSRIWPRVQDAQKQLTADEYKRLRAASLEREQEIRKSSDAEPPDRVNTVDFPAASDNGDQG